jgi:ribosomal protein S27AE
MLGNDESRKLPVKYWTRTCLKCGRVVRILRSRWTCNKCFLQNMEARAGLYGSYGPDLKGVC